MSDLLNSASLVLIPSGYKEDTVYSVVPSDGSGDLSFTRASNGTRVNSAGLVEVCPWNLADNSENFTLWGSFATGGTITRTANYATAPNGTMTATRIQNSGGSVVQWTYQDINLINGGTISMYVKRTGSTNQTFRLFGNNGAEVSSNFTATSEWQRFEFTILPSGSTKPHGITTDSSANAADILVWGGQINIGSTAKPYFPTTDRLNVPRLTYQNGGGGCPSLLLEKQSTNVALYSEDFSQTVWGKPQTTITTNATTSPDGTQNADRMFETAVTDNHGIYQNMTLATGTNYAVSCYVKKGNRSYCGLQFWYNVTNGAIAFFNLDNGTLVYEYATSSGGGFSVTNSKIEDVGNGWYRLSGIFQVGITDAYPGLVMASTQWSTGTSYDNQYLGDTSKYIDIWGAQIEASSYPTSYIPTTSASATRVADACFKTGISSLIGQTEGVIFWDGTLFADNETRRIQMISDDTDDNRILMTLYQNKIEFVGVASSSVVFAIQGGTITTGRYKIAGAYKANDFVLYVNGTQIGTDTSGSVPACSRYDLGQDRAGVSVNETRVNETAIFKTRLTNAELASLTTI